MNPEEAVVFPWHPRDEPSRREIPRRSGQRLEAHVAEILTALGMDLDTPGTAETPQRFLRALYDATAGLRRRREAAHVVPRRAPGRCDRPARPDR